MEITHKPKFAPGDRVTMTNDYGAVFPRKTILSFRQTDYGPAYFIEPTDTPWYAVPERNLSLAPNHQQTPRTPK